MKQRILNMLIALDSLVLVWCTLGIAHPTETISSAAWRAELNGQFFGHARPIIDWLLQRLESNHCKRAYDFAVARMNLPEDMRR